MSTQLKNPPLPDLKGLMEQAQEWRSHNQDYIGERGVIVFMGDEVQGWMSEIRYPAGWQPGCIAVDEEGNAWAAVGGNSYDGAERWQSIALTQSQPEVQL